jgi:hypothetical protein
VDNEQLLNQIKKLLEGMEQRMATKVDLEAVETKILTAFYGWARTAEGRIRAVELQGERISALEARQFELEKRLHDIEHPRQ